ncbi:hypothetical protein FM076_17990 [Streptomyces albus subsp. chlorinus]|nr:hypothetical protein [Streptomyces albus subsp. chlorinus]
MQERPVTDARTLLHPETRALLAADVQKKFPDMSTSLAERGVGQMLAFLAAGTQTAEPLSPSPIVDEFWHAFILHTEAYAEFCDQTFGRFIHHRPEYLDPAIHGGAKAVRARTIDAITAAGYVVDAELWPELDVADCNQCHAGCYDSPNGNN